jgi:hypothetical protein
VRRTAERYSELGRLLELFDALEQRSARSGYSF